MDLRLKPIPAFYCCYLLRSTVRPSSVYVGSSPHPSRRLAQHNGKVKGGAVRTSRLSLRPWEMLCVVAGFPSNIAALQFEWAWQNAHLTRHITAEQRISFPTTRVKTNAKTGKTRRKPGRPRTSMTDKLANLHLLLCASYFSKWPLELRFFSQDAHQFWQTWCERTDKPVRSSIKVVFDPPQDLAEEEEFSSAQKPPKQRKIDLIGKGGADGVDPTYARYQEVVAKSQRLIDSKEPNRCGVCAGKIVIESDLYTVCPESQCQSMAHMTCLSHKFLTETRSRSMIPKEGACPSCGVTAQWVDLMRAMSLRIRGEKDVRKLLSKKRQGRAAMVAEILEDSEDEDFEDEVDHLTAADVVAEESASDAGDSVSVFSTDSVESVSPVKVVNIDQPRRLEIVIEDSEDD